MRYVYLLRAGQNHYKVGIATNVSSRIRSIQTSNANIIRLVTARAVTNPSQVEKTIHAYLAEMKLDGGKEWFELTEKQVVNLAIKINTFPTTDVTEIKELWELMQVEINLQHKISGRLRNLYEQILAERDTALRTVTKTKVVKEFVEEKSKKKKINC